MKNFSLDHVATELGAELRLAPGAGPADDITGLNTLAAAAAGDLSFLASANYRRFLEDTAATAVLVKEADAVDCPVTALVVKDPYLAFARATALFDDTPHYAPGIEHGAQVHENAEVDPTAVVRAGAVISAFAKIGAGAVIGPNCVVGEDSVIGAGTQLRAGVVVYHNCHIGEHCIIHSNSVIGSDGFGFAPAAGGWEKIYQLGGVEIGDHVEIGSCTTIDRGALGNTVIGRGVKIDNHVQIAHNVEIGDYTAMAAYSAVAGSAKVGKRCLIAGDAGIVGHISIADGTQVMAKTLVTSSIDKPGSYSSGTPYSDTRSWRKNAVRFSQLDKIARKVAELEKKVGKAGE